MTEQELIALYRQFLPEVQNNPVAAAILAFYQAADTVPGRVFVTGPPTVQDAPGATPAPSAGFAGKLRYKTFIVGPDENTQEIV